jgi:3-oxoacyl-[acyl-carrier-protein] synthase-3
MTHHSAILGTGYAVGPVIRTNDDPIFDWIKAHPQPGSDFFRGYKYRRVLPLNGPPGSPTLSDLMTDAVRMALDRASVAPEKVDALLGYGSVGPYLTPNPLALVNANLKLRADSWILPVDGEENFLSELFLADGLIRAGRIKHAVVVTGFNWTNFVSYHTAVSVAASDGAGAVVLGPASDDKHFKLVDFATETLTAGYGTLFMSPDPVAATGGAPTYTAPYLHITSSGDSNIKGFGAEAPPRVANRLLTAHGLTGKDITLVSHQSSRTLMDAWSKAIQPGHYVDSLEEYADMVGATVPVNLGRFHDQIQTDYLMLLDVGLELKAVAALLRRNRDV